MKVELFHSPACSRCAAPQADLEAAAKAAMPDVEWCEVNALNQMVRAVEYGVLSLPAVAINGELVFASLPTTGQLRAALIRKERANGLKWNRKVFDRLLPTPVLRR